MMLTPTARPPRTDRAPPRPRRTTNAAARHLTAALAALLAGALTPPTAAADLQPGLVGEYFKGGLGNDRDEHPATAKPFLVRVDKQVNFPEVAGDFYGAKLADGFAVRWTGVLRAVRGGRYTFFTHSDDGSRLYLGGRRVVENWGAHSMTEKSGSVDLEPGDHEIKIVYTEGGGGAGCIVSWKPPGGRKEPLPAGVLFHRAGAEEAIAWDAAAWKQVPVPAPGQVRRAGGGVAFDARFGPVLSTAIKVGRDPEGDNVAFRGRVVRLDPEADTCVVFDADTLRMAAGWSGPGLVLSGLPFTSGHGQFPLFDGEPTFTLRAGPGWARGGDGDRGFDDPRPGPHPPLGPLPPAWARYGGLYTHGENVVFRYTVGGAEVLESPSVEAYDDGERAIVRTFQVDRPAREPLALAVADAPERSFVTRSNHRAILGDVDGGEPVTAVALIDGPGDARLVIDGGLLRLDLPAAGGELRFKLFYWRGPAGQLERAKQRVNDSPPPADLRPLTRGGPPRWTDPVVTEGSVSAETEKPYVVDRLTVPHKNPFGARMRIGGMDFFPDGRAAVSTWDGDVWVVGGIDEDLDQITWKRFATGLHEPLGLVVKEGAIYTVGDDQITRLHDLDGDGEADYHENVNNGWDLTSGFHAFCFDLHTDPEGDFIFAFGCPVRPGGSSFQRMGRHHGSVLKVSADGSRLERYATGLRAPNGIGVGPDGQVTSGDNEGTFVPRCPIHWVDRGEFLGVVDSAADRDKLKTTPTISSLSNGRKQYLDPSEAPLPLAWLPKNIDNSGGGQTWITSRRWGPFAGEMLHLSYGRSALYLVLKEERAGVVQGGVVPLDLRFSSSAMRGRFNPRDGQLYVAGLKGWQSNAASEGGFDRVRYTGAPVYLPGGLRAAGKEVEITFTQALDAALAEDPESYAIRASDIRWTHGYGSSEYEIGQRGSGAARKGWTRLEVGSARLLPDKKTVRLTIPKLQPAHQVEIQIDLEAEDGTEIITRLNHTIHRL